METLTSRFGTYGVSEAETANCWMQLAHSDMFV